MRFFKKFVQRIRNRTGVSYWQWSEDIKKNYRNNSIIRLFKGCRETAGITDIYVYGHSLDITDKDILELFLRPEYTRLHIFAKDCRDEGKLIMNLIKIISERTVMLKSAMNPPRLEILNCETGRPFNIAGDTLKNL